MSTAADVITAALELLDEDPTAPVFWTRAELLVLVNDGFLEYTIGASQLTSEATYPLVGAKVQAVPLNAIAIIHVAYSNELVEKTSIEVMDRGNPNWAAQYGILQRWAPCGLDKWIIDRHPISAQSVSLTVLNAPTTLAETDTIDLAPEFIESLIDYVYHAARFKEGGAEFGQSMEQYDEFKDKVGIQERKTFAQQFVLWSRDPNAGTGEKYAD